VVVFPFFSLSSGASYRPLLAFGALRRGRGHYRIPPDVRLREGFHSYERLILYGADASRRERGNGVLTFLPQRQGNDPRGKWNKKKTHSRDTPEKRSPSNGFWILRGSHFAYLSPFSLREWIDLAASLSFSLAFLT